LELGADDYVTKPFSPRELLARVRAAIRSYAQTDHPRRSEVRRNFCGLHNNGGRSRRSTRRLNCPGIQNTKVLRTQRGAGRFARRTPETSAGISRLFFYAHDRQSHTEAQAKTGKRPGEPYPLPHDLPRRIQICAPKCREYSFQYCLSSDSLAPRETMAHPEGSRRAARLASQANGGN